eukprot:gene36381-44133_t
MFGHLAVARTLRPLSPSTAGLSDEQLAQEGTRLRAQYDALQQEEQERERERERGTKNAQAGSEGTSHLTPEEVQLLATNPSALQDRVSAQDKERAQASKAQGNALFQQKQYAQAAEAYGQALAFDRFDHTLYSNRMFEDAALAAFEGLKLDEKNQELKDLLQEAVRRGQQEHQRQQKLLAK